MPGAGRGVVATRDIAAGELLIMCRPLAYAAGPEGEIPDMEQLLQTIRSVALSPLERQALLSLHSGVEGDDQEAASGSDPRVTSHPFGDIQALMQEQAAAAALRRAPAAAGTAQSSGSGSGSGSSSAARGAAKPGAGRKGAQRGAAGAVQPAAPGLSMVDSSVISDEQLEGVLACNCFGEEFHDMQLAGLLLPALQPPAPHSTQANAAAQATPPPSPVDTGGHLGLWPAFSLLNHSCLPNAVNYVWGDVMVVHAARHVPQGGEVSINYLGRESLRPPLERQHATAAGYGFSCACPRCTFELTHGASVSERIQAACDELGGRLGPRLNQAAAAGDMDGVRRVQADAEAMVAELDAVTDQLVKAQHARGSSGMEGMEGLAEAGRKRAGRGRGRGRGKSAEQRAGSGLADEPGRHVDGTAGGAAGSMGAGPEWQWWLRASALDAHALVATACEVLGAREELLASLERQLAIVRRVAPGSDLHIYTAVKRLSLAQAAAAAASSNAFAQAAASTALQECMDAAGLRYGAFLLPQAQAAAPAGSGAAGRADTAQAHALSTAARLVECAAQALERIMM